MPALPLYKRRFGVALVSVLALSACDITTGYVTPKSDTAASFSASSPTRAEASRQWWTSFNDQRMNGFVAAGLARNLDVQQAIALIQEAEANVVAAGAPALPSATVGASASRGNPQGTGTTTSTAGTLQTSWMIDLFGGNRASQRGAIAQRDAAYLSVDVAKLAVASAIASAYIDLRFNQESIALTRQSIESRREGVELTRTKVEFGSGAPLELLQAEQLVAQAEAELPALEVGFDQALNRLATLTGTRTAEIRADMQRGAPQPRPRFRANVGVPVEVIRSRPDVRKAERDYAAAVANVGVAEAAFYPSLTLSGTITPTNFTSGGNQTTWAVGPQLSLPILTGGANTARLRGAEARASSAQIAWRSEVLSAIEEVENGLAAYNRDGRNIAAQSRLVSNAEETLEIARTSYDVGDSEFFNVLDSERTLLDARRSMASAVRQQAQNFVTLSVAADGGV